MLGLGISRLEVERHFDVLVGVWWLLSERLSQLREEVVVEERESGWSSKHVLMSVRLMPVRQYLRCCSESCTEYARLTVCNRSLSTRGLDGGRDDVKGQLS